MKYRAEHIPDRTLRHLALDAQKSKWGNLEGAAVFATFVPRQSRTKVARLLVCLQGIYDYSDTLAEQPSTDPQANAIMLHSAMLDALKPGSPYMEYYTYHHSKDDGGYLVYLIDSCRRAIEQLPTYLLVAKAALINTQRIVDYQALINYQGQKGYALFMVWAESETPAGTGLRWWETGAACGSSLAIFALLAAAANPALTPRQAIAIEATYWPWANALHTLLDNLIDYEEDSRTGQHNLTDHYPSQEDMTERFDFITCESVQRANEAAPHHMLVLAGMIALYLSDDQARVALAQPTTERVAEIAGMIVKLALLVLKARRLSCSLTIKSWIGYKT